MALNIKSEEAHRKARELAQLTGESLTEAVTRAIAERLERLRPAQVAPMSQRLRQIRLEVAPRLQDLPDHAGMLYGEDGLPR